MTQYQDLLTDIELWLQTMRETLTAEIRSNTETELNKDIAHCNKMRDEFDSKESKLSELSKICEEFQKYPDLKTLSDSLLEQLRTLTVIFVEHRRLLKTRIDSLNSYLIKLKTGDISPARSESTIDSTSMPIEEVSIQAEKAPIGISIETQTGHSLSTPTPPLLEPLTRDISITCKPPIDAQTQVQLSEPSSEVDFAPGKQSITILKTVSGKGETIQIDTRPVVEKQPIIEEPSDLLVQANYRTVIEEPDQQTSELNISNFKGNKPFETIFVEPDETTTEVIVDADGTKRIIVKKLHRTLVSRKQTVQQQQLTTLSSVTDGNVPVCQSFSQVTLQDQQSSTAIAKGDGRKEILTTQTYGGKIVTGIPGGEVDVHEFQAEPQHQYEVIEETKPSEIEVEGVKLHEGDITFVDNQNMLVPAEQIQLAEGSEIQTSSSTVRAVVQHVTRRIIRKTRRIIRRVVIVNGKEEVTEEVVEEPEEVEISEENFPRVSINVTKTEDGKIVEEHRYGDTVVQPETITVSEILQPETVTETIKAVQQEPRYVVEHSSAQEPVGAPITTEAVQIISESPASIEITSVSNVTGDFIQHEKYARSTTESSLQFDKALSKESTPITPVSDRKSVTPTSISKSRLDSGDTSKITHEIKISEIEKQIPETALSVATEIVENVIEAIPETITTPSVHSADISIKEPTLETPVLLTTRQETSSSQASVAPSQLTSELTEEVTQQSEIKKADIKDVTSSFLVGEKITSTPEVSEEKSSDSSKDSKKQKKRKFKNGKQPPRCQTPSDSQMLQPDDEIIPDIQTEELEIYETPPEKESSQKSDKSQKSSVKPEEPIEDFGKSIEIDEESKPPSDTVEMPLVKPEKEEDRKQSVEFYLSLSEKTRQFDPAQVSMFMKYEESENKPLTAEIVRKDIQVTLPVTTEETVETVRKSIALSPIKPEEIHDEDGTPSDIDHGGRKSKRKKKHKESKTPTEEEEYSIDSSLAESTEIIIPEDSRPSSETPKPTEEAFETIRTEDEEELSETGKETGYEADKTTVDDADDENVDKKKRRKKKRKQKVKTKDIDESLTPQSVYDSTPFGKSIEYTDDDSTVVVAEPKLDDQKKNKKKKKGRKEEVTLSETDAKETETDGQRDSDIHTALEEEVISPDDTYRSVSTPSEPGTVKIIEEGIPSRPTSESPKELATKIISTVPVLEAIFTQESTIQTSPETVSEYIEKEPVALSSAQTSPIHIERSDSEMQTFEEIIVKPEVSESYSQVEIDIKENVTQTSTPEKVDIETCESAMQTTTPEKIEAIEEYVQTITPETVDIPRSESAMQTHTVDLKESSMQTKSPDVQEVQTSDISIQLLPSDICKPVEQFIQTSPELFTPVTVEAPVSPSDSFTESLKREMPQPSAPPLDAIIQTSLPYISMDAPIPERVDTAESVSQTYPVVVKEIGALTPASTPSTASPSEYEVQVKASFTVPSAETITKTSEVSKGTVLIDIKPKPAEVCLIESKQTEELTSSDKDESSSESETEPKEFDVQLKVEGIPESNVVTSFLQSERGEDKTTKKGRKRHKKKKDKAVVDKTVVHDTNLFDAFKRAEDRSDLLDPKLLYSEVTKKGSRSASPVREDDETSVIVSKVITDLNLEQMKKIIDVKPTQEKKYSAENEAIVNVTVTLPDDSSETPTPEFDTRKESSRKKGRKRKANDDVTSVTPSTSEHESLEFQITIKPLEEAEKADKSISKKEDTEKPAENIDVVIKDIITTKAEVLDMKPVSAATEISLQSFDTTVALDAEKPVETVVEQMTVVTHPITSKEMPKEELPLAIQSSVKSEAMPFESLIVEESLIQPEEHFVETVQDIPVETVENILSEEHIPITEATQQLVTDVSISKPDSLMSRPAIADDMIEKVQSVSGSVPSDVKKAEELPITEIPMETNESQKSSEVITPTAPPYEELFVPKETPEPTLTETLTEFIQQEQLPSTPITHSLEFVSELPEELNKSESSSSVGSQQDTAAEEKLKTESKQPSKKAAEKPRDKSPAASDDPSVSSSSDSPLPITEVNIHIEIPMDQELTKIEPIKVQTQGTRQEPEASITSELTINVPKENVIKTKPSKNKHTTSVTIEEVLSPTEIVDVPISPSSAPLSPPDFTYTPTTSVWDKPIAVADGKSMSEQFITTEKHVPVPVQELQVKWNQTQAIERVKNLQNARNTTHLSDVLYLATLNEVITEETIEQRNNDVRQHLTLLKEAVTQKDVVVIQQTIITTVETITTWLETIEYRIYLNRQQTEEGPSKEKLQTFNNLKQEIANIEQSVSQLQEALNSATEMYNDADRNKMIENLKALQEHVRVIEIVTHEHGKLAESDLRRWEEFINGVQNVTCLINDVKQEFEELKESDISPNIKMKELESLEITNRCHMLKAVNLISSAKSLLRDFPGREIPQEVYMNHEITKHVEHGISSEREKCLQLLSLADEYEQTLKDFSQIIEIAEALVESQVAVNSLEHLEEEMQNHRKFFVNLSHCRAILESLEENLDSETRTLHSGLHQNLYQRASFILDKATGRFQLMSSAASKWTVLEQGMREELRWLEVAQQRVPDLTSVTSADYDQYINLYQSLSLDISHHHTKLVHLNSVAHKLQEMVNCPELDQIFTNSLGIIVKLQDDVNGNLRRLIAFRDTWTTYNLLSDKLEYWLKDAEQELMTMEIPKDTKVIAPKNMRQFWVSYFDFAHFNKINFHNFLKELKAQHEVHNGVRLNATNHLEKSMQVVPVADEMVQRKFHTDTQHHWQRITESINSIQNAILETISAPDVPLNEKLAILEQELLELKVIVESLHGIIKNEEELNLYVGRLQIMSTRVETIQNELSKVGLLSATESEKVGSLLALSKRLETQITEELEGSTLLKERLQAIQRGLARVRKHHSKASSTLDQCESAEKLGSEAVEKAVNECYEVGEELVTLWQDLMSLRQLLHTLPMRLRVTVSPIKVERDISQLQDDHTALEKQCGTILALLRNRLALWQRFERQLELVQQNVQEADFMMDLLTVQGTVDYDRLLKATERLEVRFLFFPFLTINRRKY